MRLPVSQSCEPDGTQLLHVLSWLASVAEGMDSTTSHQSDDPLPGNTIHFRTFSDPLTCQMVWHSQAYLLVSRIPSSSAFLGYCEVFFTYIRALYTGFGAKLPDLDSN